MASNVYEDYEIYKKNKTKFKFHFTYEEKCNKMEKWRQEDREKASKRGKDKDRDKKVGK